MAPPSTPTRSWAVRRNGRCQVSAPRVAGDRRKVRVGDAACPMQPLTCYTGPRTLWRQIRAVNPLERLAREIRGRLIDVGPPTAGHSTQLPAHCGYRGVARRNRAMERRPNLAREKQKIAE